MNTGPPVGVPLGLSGSDGLGWTGAITPGETGAWFGMDGAVPLPAWLLPAPELPGCAIRAGKLGEMMSAGVTQ